MGKFFLIIIFILAIFLIVFLYPKKAASYTTSAEDFEVKCKCMGFDGGEKCYIVSEILEIRHCDKYCYGIPYDCEVRIEG